MLSAWLGLSTAWYGHLLQNTQLGAEQADDGVVVAVSLERHGIFDLEVVCARRALHCVVSCNGRLTFPAGVDKRQILERFSDSDTHV